MTPIFPLPNVVFFPHTFLPLYIFEPRYRAMIADVLDGDRMIVVVLMRGARSPAEEQAVHQLGCVGRVTVVEDLPDGRYSIVLHGLSRVEIGPLIKSGSGYCEAHIRLRGEMIPDLQDPEVAESKSSFLLTARRYGELVLGGDYALDLLSDGAPYPTIVNRVAGLVQRGVADKQALLTIDDIEERAARLAGWMTNDVEAHEAAARFTDRRPADPRLN